MNPSDTRSPKIVEEQLHGKQANLDGALRWYSRHIGGADAVHLTRLELRHPSLSDGRVDEPEAQRRIRGLLEDKAFVAKRVAQFGNEDKIPVSVRPHELDMDKYLTHLTVRAFFNLPPKEDGPAEGWLNRLRQLFKSEDDTDDHPQKPVDVSTQQAVDTLLRGLERAVELFGRGRLPKASALEVGEVQITVNTPELHRALAPRMPPLATHDTTRWMASHLLQLGLQPVQALKLTFRFDAPTSEHTQVVSDWQLKVLLAPPKLGESDETATDTLTGTPMPSVNPGSDTPMPLPEPALSSCAPTVHLRVLGTWQGGALVSLAEPFACDLGPVPALFSRSTLELKGFTRRADAALARAASNSTPLHFSADGQGGIKLHASHRPGSELAMYFFLDGLAPCTGEHPLDGPQRLVVNGPAPLENGLFPLVIEVIQGIEATK